MKSSLYKKSGKSSKDSGKCCSIVMCISWTFIILWMVFLVACWKYGLLDQKKVENLVEKVDTGIIQLENTIEDRFEKLKHLRPMESIRVRDPDELHVVFSTDCTPYQDWQTLVLFHSAKTVGQKGRITRIASGCTDEKKVQLNTLYKTLYGDEYGAHYTPDFKKDAKTKKKYDFYNKPWGLKHWLENSEYPIPDDEIIALLDPDMIFLRPLTPHISTAANTLFRRNMPESEIIDRVKLGRPAAQTYGLGAPWANDNHPKFGRGRICGEGSPCLKPTTSYGGNHYSVGPPYIAHKQDFIRIASSWTKFVPRVYEKYPYLLAEMYAYSMAAAHEELPHIQMENHMVSNVDSGGEGWPWIDKLDETCQPPINGIFYPGKVLPTVVHFCQTYAVEKTGFAKRRVPKNIFTCESPLFVDTPPEFSHATYYEKKDKQKTVVKFRNKIHAKRTSFMLCAAHAAVNAALVDFKMKMCGQNVTNYEKKINVWDGPN